MNEYNNMDEKNLQNKKYDYSNRLATIECVSYLVQYVENIYHDFLRRMAEDEEKNKPLKPEYRDYIYKKSYQNRLEVYISKKGYNSIRCKDFTEFQDVVKAGYLKDVLRLEITLQLDFKRGREENLEEHENSFVVKFQPYEIEMTRSSNYKDPIIDQIETNILEILNQFPVANCIFCDKN